MYLIFDLLGRQRMAAGNYKRFWRKKASTLAAWHWLLGTALEYKLAYAPRK
ncbi:MAG: hypothetical protein M3495_10710 [Pseudomonadota bacterium]|nr:hypothetical protein [Gammaproteobacteria bacterium]MDQ3582040.1 hypothetical protein [Pseudomonadota bacterium]